jgi:hypothetical protein
MSAATKKKHVFHETINNFVLPTSNQQIVRVIRLIYHIFFTRDISKIERICHSIIHKMKYLEL